MNRATGGFTRQCLVGLAKHRKIHCSPLHQPRSKSPFSNSSQALWERAGVRAATACNRSHRLPTSNLPSLRLFNPKPDPRNPKSPQGIFSLFSLFDLLDSGPGTRDTALAGKKPIIPKLRLRHLQAHMLTPRNRQLPSPPRPGQKPDLQQIRLHRVLQRP
jgi:hypothetical protein